MQLVAITIDARTVCTQTALANGPPREQGPEKRQLGAFPEEARHPSALRATPVHAAGLQSEVKVGRRALFANDVRVDDAEVVHVLVDEDDAPSGEDGIRNGVCLTAEPQPQMVHQTCPVPAFLRHGPQVPEQLECLLSMLAAPVRRQ